LSVGATREHCSIANGQRGWKWRPDGGSIGEGTSPLRIMSSHGASHPRLIVRSPTRRRMVDMEDLTRFGLALLSVPVVIVAGGVLLGLIGRWATRRRDG
jgi:hypothetical protein